jgi:hypothetical protein
MTTSNLITSQSYIDEQIVASKIEAGDFEVLVSPAFEIDGRMIRVILDGHHSFEAARRAGIEAEITEQTARDDDRVALIEAGQIETFLEVAYMDSEYRFAETGAYVF